MKLYLLAGLCFVLLVGCSSSSTSDVTSGSGDQNTVQTGVFSDSAVSGLSYQTETLAGVTDESGRFEYLDSETVTFSIGSLIFPPLQAAPILTPVDMSDTADMSDNIVVNTARLLQSLDADGDVNNGITISEQAAASASPVDLTIAPELFEQESGVLNLVANSGSTNTDLVSGAAALSHLNATIFSNGFVRMLEDDFDSIFAKRLLIGNDYLIVNVDGTMDGEFGGEPLAGTWEIVDDYWCRTLTVASENALMNPTDCQLWERTGNQIRGTRNKGEGISFGYAVALDGASDTVSRLAGDWKLIYESGCFETLTFNSDSTIRIVELGEIQTGTYSVSDDEVANSRYNLNINILTDNQEPGCDGEIESSADRTFTFYVEIESTEVLYYSSIDSENAILQLTRQ